MTGEEKTFTQQDFDNFKSELEIKHQEDLNALAGKLRAEFKEKEQKAKEAAEKAAKQANMSELEKATNELAELKAKYQEKEDIIALSAQKDETRKFMSELGVDEKCLDYIFIPKDIEGTKSRAKAFKEYIDNVKKETFESNLKSKIPNAKSDNNAEANDVFLQGFNS